jgi:hypothetical protein
MIHVYKYSLNCNYVANFVFNALLFHKSFALLSIDNIVKNLLVRNDHKNYEDQKNYLIISLINIKTHI